MGSWVLAQCRAKPAQVSVKADIERTDYQSTARMESAKLKAVIVRLTNLLAEAEGSTAVANEKVRSLEREVDAIRARSRQLEEDSASVSVTRLKVKALEREVESLRTRNRQLDEEAAQASTLRIKLRTLEKELVSSRTRSRQLEHDATTATTPTASRGRTGGASFEQQQQQQRTSFRRDAFGEGRPAFMNSTVTQTAKTTGSTNPCDCWAMNLRESGRSSCGGTNTSGASTRRCTSTTRTKTATKRRTKSVAKKVQ